MTGDTLVATCADWNQPPAGSGAHAVSVYATSVPLTSGKKTKKEECHAAFDTSPATETI